MKTVLEIIVLAKHVVESSHGPDRFTLKPEVALRHTPTNTVVHAHQVIGSRGTPSETVIVKEFARPVPVDCFEAIETEPETAREGAD